MSKLKSLKIRMYRGILGDCFLLQTTVVDEGNEEVRKILIDCGVLQNIPSGEELIRKLAREVVQEVGILKLQEIVAGPERISAVVDDLIETVGSRIDLLILTHEHFDHLCGFAVKKDVFLDKNLEIGELWLAWTEDPNDEQAKTLQARFNKGRQALISAVKLTETLGADTPARLQSVASLAAFAGPGDQPNASDEEKASGRMSTGAIIQMMKNKVGAAKTRYLEPGEVIDLKAFGLIAYVLGPPRDETLLKKDSPSSQNSEVYLMRLDAVAAVESSLASQLALQKDADAPASTNDGTPFARPHQRPFKSQVTAEAYGPETFARALYADPAESWRTIDDEWLGAAEALALKMDSDTNNTSLALAFALPDEQVLLFPGDAQVGNWLSWNNQTYPHTAAKGITPTTAEELLNRVTFYKVGHHGSHNATLKTLGLARMIDPRLTAAIPVVEAVAAIQGKGRSEPGAGWKMPYGKMYDDLQKRTKGRILRGDGDIETETLAFQSNPTHPERPVTVTYEASGLWTELHLPLE
ncbi:MULTISPECIES: hypothetical protein [Rhizobium]|uniref:Metallo-beta-lactamase domain-containing protein n=1 Tax=Rhizobium favelukesii TaxID=348824 RepID=W6RSP5_9HYPH|nr:MULTISPECIES: hypothetical protein [Rhizobium]MCA0804552.1 hypothetical protein [Rhizobium sp. T1473]MCS0462775.1 hypothetical protein [Rhizobium favelukesii]UFS80067.1 hypothetical protein LPB79_01850 [Rhizobium sp. T136]CDM61818.1 hypothetical protein LPU83_pLPU83d_0447 [Rhizobium favelukesii]